MESHSSQGVYWVPSKIQSVSMEQIPFGTNEQFGIYGQTVATDNLVGAAVQIMKRIQYAI